MWSRLQQKQVLYPSSQTALSQKKIAWAATKNGLSGICGAIACQALFIWLHCHLQGTVLLSENIAALVGVCSDIFSTRTWHALLKRKLQLSRVNVVVFVATDSRYAPRTGRLGWSVRDLSFQAFCSPTKFFKLELKGNRRGRDSCQS